MKDSILKWPTDLAKRLRIKLFIAISELSKDCQKAPNVHGLIYKGGLRATVCSTSSAISGRNSALAPLIDKWGIQKKWLQILKFSSNQNYYNHWVTHKVNCKLLNSYRPSLLGIFAFASLIDRRGHTEATIWPLPHTHRQTSHTTLHQYTTKTLQKLCIEATDQIMPWHDFRPCVTNQTRYLPVPVR